MLDAADPLRDFRERFAMPPGIVYLDGNSLGALPRSTVGRLKTVIEEQWGTDLIRSWNRHDWIHLPLTVGAKIARLIGAAADEVAVTDSTSVNVFRLVLSALMLTPGRGEIVSEAGNFPTDLYVCEGAAQVFGRGCRLTVVPRERILDAIGPQTSVVLLTHVHYKTGDVYPMADITAAVHSRGAHVIWDLSHTAGALPVDLAAANADFAVGCGYKYLNGGPGAPSFLFVARRHQAAATNPISGWFGHADPFEFQDAYVPAAGIRRFLAGTPSVLANAALESGVDLLLEAGIAEIAAKSQRLCDLFIDLVERQCAGHGLQLVSPRQANRRGSQVSFAHPNGYEIMQALIARSVIGDFRAPDTMRFGFTPLYTRFEDVWHAVDRLKAVLESGTWRDARFAVRTAVT